MKYLTLILVIALLCLCLIAAWAEVPKPKSAGFTFGPEGMSATYLHDGHNYSLAAGTELKRNGNLVQHAWVIYQPENNKQFGLAGTLGYEIPLVKNRAVILTPHVGVEQPLTEGLDGKSEFKAIWGVSLGVHF